MIELKYQLLKRYIIWRKINPRRDHVNVFNTITNMEISYNLDQVKLDDGFINQSKAVEFTFEKDVLKIDFYAQVLIEKLYETDYLDKCIDKIAEVEHGN
ncbi:MAG: hypothetical protein KBD76_13155 [Bacteriovorax sp.]|nr:hypothetical protein [Bacteriovorax sp.]